MQHSLSPSTRRLPLLAIMTVSVIGTIFPTAALADYADYDCQAAIDRFLNAFRTGDKAELAHLIHFPLGREYPIPAIERNEFLTRYHEVFDAEFSKIIIDADPTDWDAVGWRGIMLHNGLLWLHYDGSVREINYDSAFELAAKERMLQLREELREQERNQLHYSLREYSRPVLEWETDTYRVRIDHIHESEYRYAAWKADVSHTTIPDIVLYAGSMKQEAMGCCGSCGGSHTIFGFTNGEYLYEVQINDCFYGKDNEDSRFNLRVWRSVGHSAAVIPEWTSSGPWCFLEPYDYKKLYNYDLLLNEPFVHTQNDIDLALYAYYRNGTISPSF